MTDQTQRLEIATVRAEIGSNITFRFNNDAIDAGGIPTESGDIKNLKLIIKEIEDKASVSTTIYPTVSTGLAATAEGGMFLVASSEEDEIYVVWRKVGGVAVDTGKRTLSSQAVETATEAAQASADESAASATTAQAAATAAVAQFQSLTSTAENAGAKLVGSAMRALSADQLGCAEGVDISAALQAACDQADARGLLLTMQGIGNAVATGDIILPQYFDGAGCVFTGNHKFIHRRRKHARAQSFTCTNMLSSGVWNSSIENINVTNRWTIDGCEADWGTFWNTFSNVRCGQIYVNVKYQAVNNNSFKECLGNAVGTYGLLITDEGATSSAGIMEAHNNTFEGCDFSQSGGARNEIIVRNQVNMLFGCYFEHGAQIIGNWNAIGCNIDGSSPPVVTSRNYVIGQADHSEATMGDSFPASTANLCVGGDWSAIDSTGKPPNFSASFAATAQGTVTPTNWGFTGRYGGTVTGAFQYLDVKFITSTGKFSSVIFMEFPDGTLPVGIEISDGTTTSYRTPSECSNEGNGRYLYRICGAATKNAECTIRFLLTGSTSATRTAFIGAAFVSGQKSALLPMFVEPKVTETSFIPGREFKKGVFSKSYTSGAPYFDVSVNYGSQFRSSYVGTPILSFLPGSAYRGNYSKYELLTATSSGFTARVYYTGEWAGEVYWQA